MTSKSTRTIKPQQALEEYLSALLSPSAKAPATVTPAPTPVEPIATRKILTTTVEAQPAALSESEKEALQRTLLTSFRVQPEVAPAVKNTAPELKTVETPATSPLTSSRAVEKSVSDKKITEKKHQQAADIVIPDNWLDNGRPEWAQQRFECLLFSVAGLKLAVPLVCLGGIHAVQNADELTPLPGMPDWFVGLMPTGQGNLRVVDTARWVMPERKLNNYAEQMRFVIRISGSDWGLACDLVDKSFSMAPEDVRWRTGRSKRPWLAGTVIEHMCALMDVDAFNRLLQESERINKYRKG